MVDRYQQHEIPLIAVTVTQYDQHAVLCRCRATHVAERPEGAPAGRSATGVGDGPNQQAWAVYLMVAHFIPARRAADILESMTGSKPSLGFVHRMLRTARHRLTPHPRAPAPGYTQRPEAFSTITC
ncbi:hypothetical protein [Nonomuraea sp. NPDC049400]|uniref:hypothetical protein n=1 Tax=Nonomuraea sp. NPDC049400 TaxID=3364352 RepID=UPI00378B5B93